MLSNQIQKTPSDVRFHVFAKRRVEPNYISPAFPLTMVKEA